MMSGVVGIFMVIVGFAWTFGAMSMGAPIFFGIFGLAWTGIAIANTIYSFKNASSKNRYSSFDIVDEYEEPDPLNERFGMSNDERERRAALAEKLNERSTRTVSGAGLEEKSRFNDGIVESAYCPFCGAEVLDGFEFCNKCGRKLP